MGDKLPITFLEIDAYCRLYKLNFTTWELDALRQISISYISELQKKDKQATPPYLETDEFTYFMEINS